MNVNITIIGGNLTCDPELRHSANGTSYCKFGVAINETYKEKQKTVFVNVTAFGRTGEVIAEYLKKGDPILINDAKLDFSEWEKNGERRTQLAVICRGFQFVGGKKDDTGVASSTQDDADNIPF